jgi:nucleotide-binding universal stress UspA family protein
VIALPRIVVGVDGSDASKSALRWAAYLAGLEDGTAVEAVMVWDRRRHTAGHRYIETPDFWSPGEDAERILTGTIHDVFGTRRPAHLRSTAIEGLTTDVLIDITRNARMLVLGSHGHGWATMLGSVSASCAERGLCPVLVVHEKDDPPE